MTQKRDVYRAKLRELDEWEPYLLAESGLPGPRGNLELAQAAADEGDEARFRAWLAFDAARAPANSALEFLPFCGAVGLGRLAAEGRGEPLEQRAAAAALCEPRLLGVPEHARQVLEYLDRITETITARAERRGDEFIALRKGLGYCWSVAVAALPEEGKPIMEKWLACDDRDVRWIMRENLKKERLARLDREWVARWS